MLLRFFLPHSVNVIRDVNARALQFWSGVDQGRYICFLPLAIFSAGAFVTRPTDLSVATRATRVMLNLLIYIFYCCFWIVINSHTLQSKCNCKFENRFKIMNSRQNLTNKSSKVSQHFFLFKLKLFLFYFQNQHVRGRRFGSTKASRSGPSSSLWHVQLPKLLYNLRRYQFSGMYFVCEKMSRDSCNLLQKYHFFKKDNFTISARAIAKITNKHKKI